MEKDLHYATLVVVEVVLVLEDLPCLVDAHRLGVVVQKPYALRLGAVVQRGQDDCALSNPLMFTFFLLVVSVTPIQGGQAVNKQFSIAQN